VLAPLTAAQLRYASMRHEFNIGSSGTDTQLIGVGKDICITARLQRGKRDGLTQVVTDDGFGSNPGRRGPCSGEGSVRIMRWAETILTRR
jgi:hypothetical protein